jgi:subtilisin-like proprotein convertase family protein
MNRRLWILLCLLCLAGAWFFWQQENGRDGSPNRPRQAVVPVPTVSPTTAPTILTAASTNAATSVKTNKFAFRLSNTTKSLDQLVGDRHAILLENAFIDTGSPLNFSIPTHLQSQGDPGAYIVQARGPIDAAFRALLARAGAEIVSYIPNNAYLVHAAAGVANGLAGNSLVQAVIPYEPYYKISSSIPVTAGQRTVSSASAKTNQAAGPSLLDLALGQKPLPAGTYLTLGLFKDGAVATGAQIEKLGGQIVARDNSPFGPVVRVQPPADWVALATLPGVQIVEPLRPRMHANDLSRVTTGVAANTLVSSNYMYLTGKNVMVEVNDSGIDANHPDFTTGGNRVFGDSPLSLVDTNGHGTHVAGTIAGNGFESTTVTDAQGSVTNANFRGMATNATLYSVAAIDNTFSFLNYNDQYLQEAPARTNALISNNSWNYSGDSTYDLAAASYDAAVRDALPLVTGSQPVLFVFSAGNNGGGGDAGGGGNPDTILSPATAKNVITVGALEQLRNITNQVTDLNSNQSEVWYPKTDSSFQVAGYSSCGNVGIGTEGTYGRFKPDVVAPGSFVISTRSEQWDQYAYYNPTNYHFAAFNNQVVAVDTLNYYDIFVPGNAVGVMINILTNYLSPLPFPANMPIYVEQADLPTTNTFDFVTVNNQVSIPPNSGGAISSILDVQNNGFWYAVGNSTNFPVNYDLITEITTTNDLGNYYTVLSNLNQSIGTFNPSSTGPGPYYRYETGTSMSAADVSGVLALMQDYFTNTLHATPSPALLKAMLINGARSDGNYDFQVQNSINYQGWGLINLPDSLPLGITTNPAATSKSMLVLDQSPTTALATGDSHTFLVKVNTNALSLPLRITLAWTDPPGDPAAAIKLVNDLNLVVSNSDARLVYYGNDIPALSTYNQAESPTNTPNYDSINNVENVYLPAGAGTNFSITVLGYRVNVNAVTAQTNNATGVYAPNVVQDYALVISSGNGQVNNAFTVTDQGITSSLTGNQQDQQVTFVTVTNAPLLNQFVGASTPLIGTNTIQLTTNGTELNGIQLIGTNGMVATNIITLGMTNQWHFYVVQNTGAVDFTNAAFITFIPDTLSIPRMGVFAGLQANATRPEADIDLYVSTDPTLTNLNPVAIANADKSLGRGGTEFVYYTNSAPGKVYYVGVYSEDQEASEYGFISIFTDIPFSQQGPNGSQIVNGLTLPVNIPDGSSAHPGIGYVFALAINPMDVKRVVVTNVITHQNFGDLIGTFVHGGQSGLSETVVLNNHDSLGNPPGPYTHIYDDSGQNDIFNSQISDGPGSLNSYVGQQGIGPWILTEVDDSLTQTGSVAGLSLLIEPHQDLTKGGIKVFLGPLGWFYDYIDVPPGATNLTIYATNLTVSPGPVDLYVKYGSIPTLTDTNEIGPAGLTNSSSLGPWNSISIGPPLAPGRYWVGLYNNSVNQQTVWLAATLGLGVAPQATYTSGGAVPILDDAVTTADLFVPADQTISSVAVGLRVDHPRVSDLVFHLISPSGTRMLLVENRGAATANMGATFSVTNIIPVSSSGGAAAATNIINVTSATNTLTITYNFYKIPDTMVVYDQGNNLIFNSGLISGSGVFNIPYTNSLSFKIVMNPTNGIVGTGWDYSVKAVQSSYAYLVLTEDTNKTTTPIKFAPTPFVPTLTNMSPGVGWINWLASAGGNDHWYLAVATNGFGVNWAVCNQIAHNEGGYLATCATAAENAFVFSLINAGQFFNGVAGNGSGPAIGGIRTNGVIGVPPYTTGWTWESGEPWGYTSWAAAEPDNCCGGQSNLVFFSYSQGSPAPNWDDIGAADPNVGGYVIERKAAFVGNDLYYLPEQSLDTVAGENAQGQWQLEIQDDRAGAGLTNTLVSWQMRFIFTEPVPTYTSLTNEPLTNTVPAGGIVYYLVNVPANADIATNTLLFDTGPLNLLFDQTTPPIGITPPDYLLLSVPGSANLTASSTPALVPGGSYYLGVQNTGTVPVNYGIVVNFHFLASPLALPQLPEQTAYANQLFAVSNSATGGSPPYIYTLTFSVTAPIPAVDANGNITWTPTNSQAPAVYTLTNIVTDSALQTATDIFNVLVIVTNIPAFPGAEGAGGYAIGGRGGDVYHVMNVNDSGPGSLRYGVQTTSGNRTIIFDVSGTITLFSDLEINQPYLTIAGQTAPGDGIAIQGLLTSVEHTHDVQARFLRCRPGDLYAPFFQDDSFHFYYAMDSIADHISASWSIDEVLSTTLSTNISVQWCMIAEPLNHSAHLQDSGAPGYQAHGYGSLIRYGSGAVSYHHNLYADNYNRNPRPGDNIHLDFINNVVFNWGIDAGYNENDSAFNPGGYTNFLNYVGNYVIAGFDTSANPNIAFRSGVPAAADTQIYEDPNLIDNNPFNIDLNGIATGTAMFSGNWLSLPVPSPMPNIPVTVTNSALAYEQVLDFAGASVAGTTVTGTLATATSLLRDPVDTDIVAGVRNKSGQIIDFISSNSFPGVYLISSFGVASGGYTGAAAYWSSQGLSQFIGSNPWPLLNPAPQPLDSDGDGIPDYWEITLAATGVASMNPAVPNNNHSNPDGYTDLEHYINWLAAPHALTVSNTPVAVDLYAIAGRSGNLTFSVADGTNGTVVLTNTIATFTPSNNYFGFASFYFNVTNLDTAVGFGPVTVSVMVSATNIATIDTLLADAAPHTNTVPAGGIAYYLVKVPTNADFATNILLFAAPSPGVNLLFSRVGFPTGTNTGDYVLMNGQTNGISILSTTSVPTNIVPGGSYYLGVRNTGGAAVTFGIEVNFHYLLPPPAPAITITSITHTNSGYLLQWQGPANYQYEIQWTTNLAPAVWNTVLNPVINVVVTSTNGHFSFFDDGTLTGGFGPVKFYRVVGGQDLGPIIGSGPVTNTVLAGAMSQAVVTVPPLATSANNLLISATGPLNVWFNQNHPPTGSTNTGDFLMLSTATSGSFLLTGSSVPPLVPGANYYLGFQNPGTSNVTFDFQVTFGSAAITAVANFSVTTTNGGIWLRWDGQTDYQYQVQWKTNLAPTTAWNTISNIVLTSTTGIFTFFDDGSLTGGFGPMKFYRLIAWPFLTPIPQTLSFTSVTVTSLGGTNDLELKWSAPTNYQYGIRWTTNLALPFSSWSILASPVLTRSNSVYTFIDNGQTGPPANAKFFQLYDY